MFYALILMYYMYAGLCQMNDNSIIIEIGNRCEGKHEKVIDIHRLLVYLDVLFVCIYYRALSNTCIY